MYFNCHTHTHYSNVRLLDSTNRPKDLVKKSMELGLAGIAITDHELLSSHVEFDQIMESIVKEKKHCKFKIAFGNEIYLTDTRESGQKYYHFILLAKNYDGYKALRELSSKSWYNSYSDRGMTRVPTLKSELEEVVKKYPNSLIATTACLGGELPTLVKELLEHEALNKPNRANEVKHKIAEFIQFQKRLFGSDFYIEVAPSDDEDQIKYNQRVRGIAQFFDVKITIGTDAHYLRPEDREVHKAFLNSKEAEREVDAFYRNSYLMSPDEVKELLKPCFTTSDIKSAFDTSLEIMDKITRYSLARPQRIPKVDVKPYNRKFVLKDDYVYLSRMLSCPSKPQNIYWANACLTRLHELNLNNKVYLDRLNEEAEVLLFISDRLGDDLTAYFNTLQSYIDLFWESGTIVGPGRGSAVGLR